MKDALASTITMLLGGVGLWFSVDFADRVPILVRLYGAHVVIVPGLILILAVLHGLLVKKHRISPHPALPIDPSGQQAPAAEPSEPFTQNLRRIAAFGIARLGQACRIGGRETSPSPLHEEVGLELLVRLQDHQSYENPENDALAPYSEVNPPSGGTTIAPSNQPQTEDC